MRRNVLRRRGVVLPALVLVGLAALFGLAGGSPAAPPLNAIQIENAKPGTPGWDDFASVAQQDAISGYGSKISVNHGDALDLYVTTTAPSFTIDVFRTGWYGGVGAPDGDASAASPASTSRSRRRTPSPAWSRRQLVEDDDAEHPVDLGHRRLPREAERRRTGTRASSSSSSATTAAPSRSTSRPASRPTRPTTRGAGSASTTTPTASATRTRRRRRSASTGRSIRRTRTARGTS